MDLEIRAERYKKDLLKKPTVNGGDIVIPVMLYRLQMRIPFDFIGEECFVGSERYIRIATVAIGSRHGLCYYGPMSGENGLDEHFLLALGHAVSPDLLHGPYTHFQQFKRPINTEMIVDIEHCVGILNLTAVGAYSSPAFARKSQYFL